MGNGFACRQQRRLLGRANGREDQVNELVRYWGALC